MSQYHPISLSPLLLVFPSKTWAGYANWQSGHVEDVAILWVRPPPRSLKRGLRPTG
jgi:hypothetical protein